jgi:hypothetical protein
MHILQLTELICVAGISPCMLHQHYILGKSMSLTSHVYLSAG